MPIPAYAEFTLIPPTKLLDIFKSEFKLIPKPDRLLKLNQGYQELAKKAFFTSLEAMQSQSQALIRVSEFIDALKSCGLKRTDSLYALHVSEALSCDVYAVRQSANLCVGIFADETVITTPFLVGPTPYSPNTEYIVLEDITGEGTWLTNDEWQLFIQTLQNHLDFSSELEPQIQEAWQHIDASECGELFVNGKIDFDGLVDCPEGRFRQLVISHSGHTCVDILYDYLNNQRAG
ncbi:hypothetical protein [Vibrio mediterranei]|uniref:hypothetical protein n=1 Tax=Vibrio mediterranei TaxID=689 RepID=UPI0040695D9E